MNGLADVLEKLRPGRAAEIAKADASPLERRDALVTEIRAAAELAPCDLRGAVPIARSEVIAHDLQPSRAVNAARRSTVGAGGSKITNPPAPSISNARALPAAGRPQIPDFRSQTPQNEFPNHAAPSAALVAEFQRLMGSNDMNDRSKAAQMYLKDPEAFMEACQDAMRSGQLRLQQQRQRESDAVEQLRRQRGWK